MLFNLKLEWRRYWREMVNFKINMIFANIGLLTLFTGLLNTLAVDDREITFILMFIWYSATHGFMNINFIIEEEIMDGTLPHIVSTRYSFLSVILFRCWIQIIFDLCKAGIVFGITMFFVPFDFQFQQPIYYFIVCLLIIVCILISYFIGLIFGVLALKYKKISSFPNLLYYFVFFFGGVTFNIDPVNPLYTISYLFPFIPMRQLLHNLQMNLIDVNSILILLVQAILYLMVGLVLYHRAMNENFRNGRLFHV